MKKLNYYGQHGDDYLLWLPFMERETSGYFVEVGALDGIRFSNTYTFEEQGWRGICVEAHPDYIEILRQNRPNSKIVFAAAGDESGAVTFYANSRGSLSTLDPTLEERYKNYGVYFTGFEEREVPMLTLAQILAEADAPQQIDVLSIDVEGAEMRVLNGMDWERYPVRLVMIEADGDEVEQQIDGFFDQIGYHKARNYYGNAIYCRHADDARLIAQAQVNCVVTLTPHPLDKQEPIQQFHVVDSQLILPEQKDSSMDSNNELDVWMRKARHYGKRLLRRVMDIIPSQTATTTERTLSPVLELGFHGDRYLLDLIEGLMADAQTFIETGTNVGTTAHYVASHYPHVQVYSCEPDKRAFAKAQETAANDANAQIYNQLSPEFLYQLHAEKPNLLKTLNLYWLDAHDYGFQWPLHDEIRHITETLPHAIILVDDAKVPGHEAEFRYCAYDGQECDYDYITNALAPSKSYRVFYPAYTEHTSKHHPLIGTIGVLHGDIAVDASIFEHFTVVEVNK